MFVKLKFEVIESLHIISSLPELHHVRGGQHPVVYPHLVNYTVKRLGTVIEPTNIEWCGRIGEGAIPGEIGIFLHTVNI